MLYLCLSARINLQYAFKISAFGTYEGFVHATGYNVLYFTGVHSLCQSYAMFLLQRTLRRYFDLTNPSAQIRPLAVSKVMQSAVY